LPQSRPRLFIVAVREDVAIPSELIGRRRPRRFTRLDWSRPTRIYAHKRARNGAGGASPRPQAQPLLAEIIEDEPTGVGWHSCEETAGLIAKMSEINLARIAEAKKAGREIVGTAYRRTRYTSIGEKYSGRRRASTI